MTNLQIAISKLQAERVSRTEYCYYDDASGKYYVSDSADLRELGRRLKTDVDAYSRWCADTFASAATKAQIRKIGVL